MKLKNLLLIAIVPGALVCSCGKKEHKEAEEVPQVDVATAFEDSVVIHRQFPGLVEADGAVEVVAQANGRILRKCFEDGAYVSRGQLLYEIDPASYSSEVAEARAAIAQAQGQLEYYKRQAAAMRKALAGDAVAEITVEQAETNVKTSTAALAAARARLQAATTALSYCRVTAPISGRTAGAVQQGSFAAAGNMLVKIVNNDNLKVTFSIGEEQYQALAGEGLSQNTRAPLFRKVPVKFGGAGTYETDLFYVSPSVNASTGTVTLQGRLADPSHRLADGMYASVLLPVATSPKALLIRDASIGTDLQGKYVYVVNDSDKVVYTPIKVSETVRDTLRIVTSGLKPGERYVTRALLTVRDGMKVKPVIKK